MKPAITELPITELPITDLPTAEQLPACHKAIEKLLGDVLIRDQYVFRQRLQKLQTYLQQSNYPPAIKPLRNIRRRIDP